jgi:hypothetical protein
MIFRLRLDGRCGDSPDAVTVDDVVMTGWQRVMVWIGAIAAGFALIGLGVYLVVIGLDRADKVASVIGMFAGLAGLALAAYGVVLTRRGLEQHIRPGGQVVAESSVGGEVLQVRGVRGNLRIGPAASPAPPLAGSASPSPSAPTVAPGSQSVTGSQVAGPVRQVDDIGGDADLDRRARRKRSPVSWALIPGSR